jgi:hypothetical protein
MRSNTCATTGPSSDTVPASRLREKESTTFRTAATSIPAVVRSSERRVYGVTDSASTCR